MNKERIIRLFYKYGLKAAIIFTVALIVLLIISFTVKRHKRLKKKKEEESKVDLKDLFGNY